MSTDAMLHIFGSGSEVSRTEDSLRVPLGGAILIEAQRWMREQVAWKGACVYEYMDEPEWEL